MRGRSRAAAGLRRTPGVVCAPPPSSRLMSGRRIGVRLRPSSGVRSWEPLRTGLMCGKNLWKHACGDEKLRTRGRSRSMQSIFLLMLSIMLVRKCRSNPAARLCQDTAARCFSLVRDSEQTRLPPLPSAHRPSGIVRPRGSVRRGRRDARRSCLNRPCTPSY